jgi:hypothetical protein
MKVNTVKKVNKIEEEPVTFYDTFYLVELYKGWYQVRLTKTHFCISCGGSLEQKLGVITKCVAKYKTPEHIYRMLEKCDHHGKMAPATYDQYRKEYFEKGHVFEAEVQEAVKKGYALRRENTLAKKVMNKLKVSAYNSTTKEKPLENTVIEEKPVTRKPMRFKKPIR